MLKHRNTYKVQPPVTMGEPVFENVEETEKHGSDLEDTKDVLVSACASCSRAIHDPKELGGFCSVCAQAVCAECAGLKCAIHRKVLCSDHVQWLRGHPVCPADSFMALLKLGVTGCPPGPKASRG